MHPRARDTSSRLSCQAKIVRGRVLTRLSGVLVPVAVLSLLVTGCGSKHEGDAPPRPAIESNRESVVPAANVGVTSPPNAVTPVSTGTSTSTTAPATNAVPVATTPKRSPGAPAPPLSACCAALAATQAQGAAQLYLQNATQYCQGMMRSAGVPGQRDAAIASIQSMLRDTPVPESCR